MARPVVCWPKPDVARLIFALMVEAECLEACLRRGFVEPAPRENAARRLDSHHCSARSLVRNHIHIEAGVPVPHCSESRRCALLGGTNGVAQTYVARVTEGMG